VTVILLPSCVHFYKSAVQYPRDLDCYHQYLRDDTSIAKITIYCSSKNTVGWCKYCKYWRYYHSKTNSNLVRSHKSAKWPAWVGYAHMLTPSPT